MLYLRLYKKRNFWLAAGAFSYLPPKWNVSILRLNIPPLAGILRLDEKTTMF
ncbi:MAG: hypothetical protein LBD18_06610 [Treponema sp.]|jgi:hypothetical protein|nr:hypothetical protein [Treponema sp.]